MIEAAPIRARQPGTTEQGFRFDTRNPRMREVIDYVQRVAPMPYPVLVLGETGTGKEVIARGIHAASGRSGVFAPLNCGAIPETLFEAELFGAERGAFTGLDSDRKGLFRVADKGTLFLDEIAEMPAAMQAKLLRVLQDGEVRPLGSSRSYGVDVRIVAATHKDLEKMVERKTFRMDLYFRISVASLKIPPLRERPEDIPYLLSQAASEAARVQGLQQVQIEDEVVELARGYAWPGNVRELLHTVANAILSAGQEPLSPRHFPALAGAVRPVDADQGMWDLPFAEARVRFERRYLTSVLERTGGNISRAAKIAGLPRSTLRDKLKRCGLSTPETACAGRPRADRERGLDRAIIARPARSD